MNSARDIHALMQEAMALHQQGQIARAEPLYREALQINPQEPNAWHLLGAAAWQSGDLQTAEDYIRKAIGYLATNPAYHCNLGGVLKHKGDFPAAIIAYRDALRLLPDYDDARMGLAETYGRYAHALAATYQWDEAKAIYRDLIELNPKDAGALNNLGQLLHNAGETRQALPLYTRAIALRPDYLIARFNRGICRLGRNDLTEGWQDLAASTDDWIPRMDQGKDAPWRHLPLWNGEDLRGKRIFVWGDQGIGDEVLYASMIPELVTRGAYVTLECEERLVPLFARSFPEIALLPRRNPQMPHGNFDFHAPGLWLARLLRPDFNTFPDRRSYLTADIKMAELLRACYASLGGGKKIIGISWHSKTPGHGAHRRMDLIELAAALPHKEILYIDLQYGDTAEERAEVQRKFPDFALHHDPVIDQMLDMDGFAAQVAACDMVITIGNTTAHIAGALGIPSAVFMPIAGLTWYWFADIENSPWYPSLRLLRRQQESGWAPALATAAAMVNRCEASPAPEKAPEDIRKGLSEILHRRGARLMAERKLDAAKTTYHQVLELDPDNTATLNNLAMILQHESHFPEARALYDRALGIAPDNLKIRYNRSLCELTEERFDKGWADLAASANHWLPMQDERSNLPWLACPLWDGSDLRGKKILIWGDQGIGDEILYLSMVPELIEHGAQVTIECMDRLAPLVARSFPQAIVLPREAPPLPNGNFDFHAPGLWLGRWLRPDAKSFPHRAAFLQADAGKTTQLRQRYQAYGKKRIIGIAWYTSSWPWGLKRSIPLPDILAPLALDDLLIVDLQYGDTGEAWAEAKKQFPNLTMIHDNEVDQFTDMDAYAAQIAACDFVLGISNTTSHVAGALGIPASILMPEAGLAWYWFARGEECPWYPSLRLLRPDMPDRLKRAAASASQTKGR